MSANGISDSGDQEKSDYSKPLRPVTATDHGFDYYFGIPASLDMDPYLYFENDRAVEQPTRTYARTRYASRSILARGTDIARFQDPGGSTHVDRQGGLDPPGPSPETGAVLSCTWR